MNYGAESRELYLFAQGETRTDGWKSEWRLEQERRRAEEMQERKFVTAAQIKVRQERKERKPSSTPSRVCEFDGCSTKIRRFNKTARCIHHCLPRPKATPRPVALCPYTGCGNKLRSSNRNGVCWEHYFMFRRLIHQDPMAMCKTCGKRVRRETKFGLCRIHARSLHSKLGNALKKERRAELKRAA